MCGQGHVSCHACGECQASHGTMCLSSIVGSSGLSRMASKFRSRWTLHGHGSSSIPYGCVGPHSRRVCRRPWSAPVARSAGVCAATEGVRKSSRPTTRSLRGRSKRRPRLINRLTAKCKPRHRRRRRTSKSRRRAPHPLQAIGPKERRSRRPRCRRCPASAT